MNQYDDISESIDEASRRRFEAAWIADNPEPIEQFLPPESDPRYLATLEELILIELELAWKKSSQGPRVEQYVERFPQLDRQDILIRLVEQEFRARFENGRAPAFDEFNERWHVLFLADPDFVPRLRAITDTPTIRGVDTTKVVQTSHGRICLGPFGGFELLEELGRGGMGVVYRARQQRPDRIVALKLVRRDRLDMLPRDSQTSALDRFSQESQAAAQLMHDHIATVYEVGQVDGEPFYSMQYVEGASLGEILREGPLSGKKAAEYLEPIARAVQAAHDRGVLHRDLKPQNILIEAVTDRPLVVDFGLAKLAEMDEQLTTAGEVMGSPPYMSPEQTVDSSRITGTADVYGLGATLYHAITGRPPFQAATPIETIRQVLERQPVAPRELNAEVDLDLETICLKCLEKEPARRYATPGDLADDLQRYIEDRPIVARPIGRVGRFHRWCRRNPVVASLTGATVFALLVAAVIGIIGYASTSAALDKAQIALGKSERSLKHARDVVHRFFTLVSEDKLLNQPGMQPLQKELLAEALTYYRRFLDDHADDPSLRDELALTNFRVGRITEKLESPSEAIPFYRLAAKMESELLSATPENRERLEALGTTQNALGRALTRSNQLDEAKKSYKASLEIRRKLHKTYPDEIGYARMLANTEMNLGLTAKESGESEQASEYYQNAMKLRESILADHPDDVETLRDLGMGYYNLGVLAAEQQQDIESVAEHFKAAINTFERLHELTPRDLDIQLRLIMSNRILAAFYLESQKSEEADQHYRSALSIAETLARNNPDIPDYQSILAGIHHEVGVLALTLGETDRAMTHGNAAREIFEQLVAEFPEVDDFQNDLAATLEMLRYVTPK